ncbi:acyl-CoA synthetase [Actinacidiphila acididurans]|uniref:Acyl-CoA synthetase n=1 Tax=Actinacidiphila acididurans TaxID=2784346 RepID=A0ABS2TM21_9ACTN|nr:acyl-CoA synthetase [Actinacidiphila acididurans]MBM9504384.1 acyl-CoA synthetase [Actinacidiphila acididurans]
MTATADSGWPAYSGPGDLAAIEAVPLSDRRLPDTTYDLLVRAATTWPERRALRVLPDAERWEDPADAGFAELLADVHRVANVLRAYGVGRGDAVTVLSPNCADLVPVVLGAQLAGVVAPVNPALTVDHVQDLLTRSGSRVAVVAGPELDRKAWETGLELARRGVLRVLLVVRPTAAIGAGPALPAGSAAMRTDRVRYLREAMADVPADRFEGTAPTADDIASLFPTGGTMGTPKLAAHLHSNEVTDAWMIAADEELDEDAAVFAGLPLFHVNALVVTLLAPMFRGRTVVWAGPRGYREPALYAHFWQIVEHYGLCAMSAVPTVYAVLAACPVDADISTLRFAMVGASPLPAAVREAFETHTGVPLVEGYGLTEATCASARGFARHPRAGAVGRRLPYQRIKVVRIEEDGSRTDLPPGRVGNVVIAGPTVFPGYVTGRDAGGFVLDPMGRLVDGWLDTGDLGRLDPDGFLHLTGRAKDLIIRGGHNIDPQVIEDALLSHPEVTAVGAVGRPDEHAGEVPVAFVTLAPGATAGTEELTRWAADHVTEAAAVPKQVTVLQALPVTDVGKPYKLELRRLAALARFTAELRDVPGVRAVDAEIVDGAVLTSVTVDGAQAEAKAGEVLARFAVAYRIQVAR